MKKKILIGLGIVVVVIIILMATGALKFSVTVTPSSITDSEGKSSKPVLPEGWVEYPNTEVGYTIYYPQDWKLQENNEQGAEEILLVAPEGTAFVRVAAFQDSSITSEETIRASMKEYEASFAGKSDEVVTKFESDVINTVGYFRVTGGMQINKVPYSFLERGMLAQNGNVIIMRGATVTANVQALAPIINQIMESFWLIKLQ